jgi:hypothetical protein
MLEISILQKCPWNTRAGRRRPAAGRHAFIALRRASATSSCRQPANHDMESDERQRPSGTDLDERTKWLEGETAWRKRIAQKTRKRQRYREDEEFRRKTLEVTAAWRAAHQEQINAWARQHRATNPEIREKDNARRREKPEPGRYLKRKYGISLADYDAMSTKLNGCVCDLREKP